MRRLLFVLALVLAVAGCGDPAPQVGEVVRKEYDDPDTRTVCRYVADDPCGYTATRTDPARWIIWLDDHVGTRGWVSIDPATYERVHVGQWFDRRTGEVVAR